MNRTLFIYSTLTVLLILFTSCVSIGTGSIQDEYNNSEESVPKTEGLTGTQDSLVEGAYRILATQDLKVNGRTYNQDCTGVVLALYDYAGIELSPMLSAYNGNGVARLNSLMGEHDLLYKPDDPAPGDILFWDDTYDRNEDGVVDDPLTHTGMVVSVDQEGTISYIHHNYRRGIVLALFNMHRPDDPEVNAAMRMKGSPGNNDRWLTSHLYRDAGRGYNLQEVQ